MPSKIFRKHTSEIREYCEENELSYDKLVEAGGSYTDEWLFIQYFDPEEGEMGLLDETPAPITLKIFLENGKLRFEQTEHTRKYLGVAPHAVAV
ncbi:hypothetical protein R80B4_00319 [Fibrobacteres bacterium R8-0-B4]